MRKASMHTKTIAPKYTPSLTKLLNKTKRQRRNTFHISYNSLAIALIMLIPLVLSNLIWLALTMMIISVIAVGYYFFSTTKSLKTKIDSLNNDINTKNIVIYQTTIMSVYKDRYKPNRVTYIGTNSLKRVQIVREKQAKILWKILVKNKYHPYIAYVITAEKSGEVLDIITDEQLLSDYINKSYI